MIPVRRLARLALLAAALGAGCAPSLIPGTSLHDTPESRAVYEVIRAYAGAMQKKDAAAVLALVAKDYYDDGGTPDPSDDLDYAHLEKALPVDLAKLESMRFELTVKSIDAGRDDATADVWYDTWFRIQTPGGVVPRRESDVHQMKLKRVDGAWKIVSGL